MKNRAQIFSLAGLVVLLFLLGGGLGLPRSAAQQEPPPAPPAEPQSEQDRITLELRRGQREPLRIALPAFRGLGPFAGESAQAARRLEDTVRRDLDLSGYFRIQGPSDFAGLPLTGDLARDMEIYRSVGNEILILGDVRDEGGRLVFEGRVFDLGGGDPILAKRYRGSYDASRRMAHTFADEVIRFLVGLPGISGTSIAFTSDRSGHKEIWLMDYDGENARRVTAHRSTSMSPAWSPGGDVIAYTSFFDGPPGIYLADLGSGRKRAVVTSGSLNSSPSFAPDGQRIAFARSVDGNVEIFSTDRSGGGLRRLTHNGAIDTNPAWSPKGNQIAFTSGRAGNPHIYLMDAEGANLRRLSFDGTYNDGASWNPNGDLLVYTSRRNGRFQIVVTDVVNLQTRVLTSGAGENESPAFAPDGRRIVFVSRRSGTKQLYAMNLDGSNVRQLTREGNNDMPDWSKLAEER
jgi:TolB protein